MSPYRDLAPTPERPRWIDYFRDYIAAFGWKLRAAIRYANQHERKDP